MKTLTTIISVLATTYMLSSTPINAQEESKMPALPTGNYESVPYPITISRQGKLRIYRDGEKKPYLWALFLNCRNYDGPIAVYEKYLQEISYTRYRKGIIPTNILHIDINTIGEQGIPIEGAGPDGIVDRRKKPAHAIEFTLEERTRIDELRCLN